MSITESGITLNFPDNNFFRFQDCQGYKDIQTNFKEMDVCWYDTHTDTLYLIELKNWGNGTLIEEQDPNHNVDLIADMKKGITSSRINNLFKKSVDSMSMFMSILLNRQYAINIRSCSPFAITDASTIKLLSIINWTGTDNTYVSSVHSNYKAKFRPYAKLFGVASYVVMTKHQAMGQFNWIA